jgi:hypothetical protein
MLARAGRQRRGGTPSPLPPDTADWMDAHSAAVTASIAGWLVCALFASVAYNWTFYYLLALAATPRDMLRTVVPARARARVAGAAPSIALARGREARA